MTPPREALAVLAVLPALLAAGCGDGEPSGGRRAIMPQSGYEVSYRPEPDPIPLNEPFELRLTLRSGRAGAPLPGTLVVDAGMPGHGHGMNTRPLVEPLGEGRFRVRGMLFHMPGDWLITVTAEREGARDQVRFRVAVP